MKKLILLSLMVVVLTGAVSLMAQTPDGSHIFAFPPIRLSNLPQNTPGPTGILPVQFKAAYGFNRIPNQGQGMTIALVDAFDDPNISSDLAFYANYFHLTPCNFQKVKVGNPASNSGWGLEESLDVEQACALAPKATIILVEANSNSFDDLLAAEAVATSAPYNATTVSNSWSGGSFSGENGYDSSFCNITAGNGQPVTFFASTGDGGHGTGYPATSPCVIGVGGTVLALSTAAPLGNPFLLDYGHEQAWNGSSGGVDPYENQPSFQNPACATWSTQYRCVPDISSPAQNIPVYDTFGYSGWVNVSGTSISSPDWAAFMTIVNSVRNTMGKGTMSQANADMYSIYYGSGYAANFHDITTGNNGSCGSQCQAAAGYDLVTGIGSFEADVLYNTLANMPN